MDPHFISCQHCLKTNLTDKLLAVTLPRNYLHHICNFAEKEGIGMFSAKLRLGLTSKEEAQQWLKDFQDMSHTTYRISRTYPKIDEKNAKVKYKIDLRCQHNTIPRSSTFKESANKKNTGCKAKIQMFILKVKGVPNSGQDKKMQRRVVDPHLPDKQLVVFLDHVHNHPIMAAGALRHRDVTEDVKEKLLNLFKQGYTPSRALEVHKFDLQIAHGDDYFDMSGDRAICPDLGFCYRLYYKSFSQKLRPLPQPPIEDIQPDATRQYDEGENETAMSIDLHTEAVALPMDCTHLLQKPENNHSESSDDVLSKLQQVFKTIERQYLQQKDFFEKPVNTFIKQASSLSTNAALAFALQCFGKYSGAAAPPPGRRKKARGLLSCKTIRVQPTALCRRKTLGGGKHRLGSGRPTKSHLSESTRARRVPFSSQCMPKRKAPHSLSKCVERNEALGKAHSAK